MESGCNTKFMAMIADNQQNVEDVLKKKFNAILQNPNLKTFLHTPCTGALESVLNNGIDTWLSHNQLDEKDNCLFGIPFEYYIVGIMGQTKSWQFISWRGDKFIDKHKGSTTFPESNAYPDLLYKCDEDDKATGFKKGDLIAIECKWTEYKEVSGEAKCATDRITDLRGHKKKYLSYYQNALKDGASCFFLAIGVGWDEEKSAPIAVYFIPASAIKDIDTVKIECYRLEENPVLNKDESLLSTFLQKSEMTPIIRVMRDHMNNLANNLGL